MVEIIPYQDQKEILVQLIEELQDYLIELDPLKRLRRLPEYGEVYVFNLLKKIDKQEWIIYLAKVDGLVVGMIAGVFDEWETIDKLECIPSKPARILELIVNEAYRWQNIGALLMNKIEEYFQNNGSDIVRVEVFEPNQSTHKFYQKMGYHDRAIDMVKKISQ